MLSEPTALKIAILGAGKIGSAFAFQLSREGGHDVTVIARPGSERLARLEADQAIVDVQGRAARVRVSSRLDEQIPYDLLIVTVLAHQAKPLLPALQRSAARCIQFMFNTFEPQTAASAVGVDRSAFGMPFVQAVLNADGRLKASIGAGGQKTLMNRQTSVDLFNAAGLPSALEPDMPLWLRSHAPLCVAFESISVRAERRGGGASWDDSLVVARGVHAAFAAIRLLDFAVYPRAKRMLEACPTPLLATIFWSLSRIASFRQLLATGEAECCALVDVMTAAASVTSEGRLAPRIAAMKPTPAP